MSTVSNYNNPEQSSSINLTEEEKKVWAILEQVADPEIPVLSIVDLGIVRSVKIPTSSIPPSGGGGAFMQGFPNIIFGSVDICSCQFIIKVYVKLIF